MYAFILFNIKNRMCTDLSKMNMSTLRNKNENIGEIIKKLNKENKSLFGNLLEKRHEKRKRETNFEPLSDESEMSSKAYWYNRLSETNCRSAPKKIPNYEREIIKSNKISNPKQNIGSTSLNVKSEVNRITSFDNNFRVSDSDVGKTVKNKGVHEVPNIIIRNIPTFPLQNKNHKISTSVPLQSVCQEDNYLSLPSVSKILNATLSDNTRAALNRWQQRMIGELGEEGYITYHRGLLEKGSQFHSVIHNFLSGTSESELNLDGVEGCWHSMNDIISNITDVRFLESHVVHPHLMYKGVIDCVASYKGKQILIEWKRSTKQKNEIEKTYDAPVQISAYIGAMNYDVKYNLEVQGGLIVVAYNEGYPATTFNMTLTDCKKYWKMWLRRLQKYWLQQHEESTDREIH